MIIIYGNDLCGYCLAAKRLAESRNLKYEFRNTDEDRNYNDLKLKLNDFKTIPQIWWHDKHIGGYDDFAAEIENTINNFGEGKI